MNNSINELIYLRKEYQMILEKNFAIENENKILKEESYSQNSFFQKAKEKNLTVLKKN